MSSGRARIDAARSVTAAQASATSTVPNDLVDGIRVYWASPGIAMRDETAFCHALRVGYQLKVQHKHLTNRPIIDAYLTAYQTAQEVGAGLCPSEIPSMRDLDSIARRVRSYVYSGESVERDFVGFFVEMSVLLSTARGNRSETQSTMRIFFLH
ncbi:hypothetical protein [Corynebacterium ulcerans]|uniref:hypothetical protein n=1 Tax=Corynebacterium ulcerans TaxID=65058 RepID=UPI000695D3D4|nr:hypothetical protein [Corynebacterium ulcerans]